MVLVNITNNMGRQKKTKIAQRSPKIFETIQNVFFVCKESSVLPIQQFVTPYLIENSISSVNSMVRQNKTMARGTP